MANSVKWAIESATKISCLYRDRELLAEAAPPTAKKLTKIADHIANNFRTLLCRFNALDGVNVHDRCAFVMGLYDGMMNETRKVGQRLPSRAPGKKVRKGKKQPAGGDGGLGVHPYTVALSLGRQIRFSAPLEEIVAELDAMTRKCLGSGDRLHLIGFPGVDIPGHGTSGLDSRAGIGCRIFAHEIVIR